MSIFRKIANFFKPTLKTFFSALWTSISENGGQLLIDVSLQAVSQAALSPGLTNEERFNLAKALVLSEFKKKGLPVAGNAINGAIEAAYAQYKAGLIK
jgi:hypothetical protein